MSPETESYFRRHRPKESNFTAPEHSRMATGMVRDYPRDAWGRRIPGKPRELVVDPRPTKIIEDKRNFP